MNFIAFSMRRPKRTFSSYLTTGILAACILLREKQQIAMTRNPLHRRQAVMRPLFYLLLALIISACQTLPDNQPSSASPVKEIQAGVSLPTYPTDTQAYRIGPDDVLNIKFFYNPELNEKLPVSPDGHIALQLINEIQVSDRTVKEIREEIERRYEPYLRYPAVSVNVIDFQSRKIYVGGEVGNPTILSLNPGMTVRQAVIMAGGARVTGALDSVLLIRDPGNGVPDVKRIDLKKALSTSSAETNNSGIVVPSNIVLRPHDVVYVPRSTIASVNLFVDQYLSQIVPSWAVFQVSYNTGTLRTVPK